jgi:molecular chaperone GrpE
MWMRTAAEFDNFRKRSRREADDAKKQGREDILRELLPVFDNLERGVQSAQRAQDVKAVIDGMQMILKQFEQTLAKLDIKKVPAVGTPFDPAVHEAIQQVESDQHPSGTVIFEVQPGYIQGEKLLRAAMVVVAKAKAGASEGSDNIPS